MKSTISESPTILPTTISQSTTMDGDATETTNIIYPTTTIESETMFTTDTVPMMTDFTTLDASSTSQGETIETEYPPMQSRIGSQEDGLINEGIKTIKFLFGHVKISNKIQGCKNGYKYIQYYFFFYRFVDSK